MSTVASPESSKLTKKRFRFSPPDLQPNGFPSVAWTAGGCGADLDRLRDYAIIESERAICWYLTKRKWKRFGGQVTRLTALLAAAVAGILPVLATILGTDGKYAVNPAWASVLLAVAAVLVGVDYFCGFTSAWGRYLRAEQAISRLCYEFQFDWEILRVGWSGQEPPTAHITQSIERIKELVLRVQQVIDDETAAWLVEFSKTLTKLGDAATARVEGLPSSAATVTVTNGTTIPSGWTLAVDDGVPTRHSGARAAVTGLRPGPHKIVVEGQVNGQPGRDEVSVVVPTQGVIDVSLTLR